MRFQLKVYKQRKSKGKALLNKKFNTPMEARKYAKHAVYYEIVDLTDKRIIEVKVE